MASWWCKRVIVLSIHENDPQGSSNKEENASGENSAQSASAPESASTAESLPVAYGRFPRMEPVWVLLLTLLTMGLYTYYWLFTRTKILNTLIPEKPISNNFVSLCLTGFVVLLVMILSLPETSSMEELQQSSHYNTIMMLIMGLNGLLLLWGILFCQRLNLLSQSNRQDALYSNYLILTVIHLLIVNTLYLQYKINQLIDNQRVDIM